MVADNPHSRLVGAAKVLFPLLALGLLSTIFLFSRTLDPSDAIPFSDIDVEQIAKEQRLAGPKFSGVTSDGSAITVSARSARPDLLNPRRISAKDITASITTVGDEKYEITADEARFDRESEDLDIGGNIQITSSTGYAFTTEQLTANLQTTSLVAEGEINGTGPGISITAGSMELSTKDGTQLLVFKGGVRLIYTPES